MELLALRNERAQLESEVGALRRQLRLTEAAEQFRGFDTIPARVLPVADLSPRARSVMIDVGSDDGVSSGLGVVGPAGVLGVVTETYPGHARVRLADDPEFRVRFHVDGNEGVAAGGPEPHTLHPHLVRELIDFEVDQILLTVSAAGRFPKDLVIGRVTSAVLPYRRSVVELAQRADETELVLVLVPTHPAVGQRD